ncbi:CoA transferase [bacterium]|nr:CoA transferase [bacterium]
MTKLLDGLRILDFSRLLPGPYGTQLLADLGADVLKIEAPAGGDYARYIPPLAGDNGYIFHALNRNRKALAVDLKRDQGREIVFRLLSQYDIVVESFRSGVMDRLGIGYEALREKRGDVIFVALSGYGATGPMQGRGAHDINLGALSGMLSMIGLPGHGPVLPGLQITDMTAGLFVALSVASAAFHRARTGEGAFVDLSMADCALSIMSVYATQAAIEGQAPGFRHGVLGGECLCYNMYETKDGEYMSVGALEPKYWRDVCAAIETPELLDEGLTPAEETNPHYRRVRDIFRSRTRDEWVKIFSRFDACVEPMLDLEEALAAPVFRERGMVGRVALAGGGTIRLVDLPIAPGHATTASPSPGIGQDSRRILRDAGYEESAIDALAESGVIAAAPGASKKGNS